MELNSNMTHAEIQAALDGGGEITFLPGNYYDAHYKLTKPCAIKGWGAAFIGGRPVKWSREGDRLVCDTDERRPIRVLVVNGGLRRRCRYPESGYMKHETVFDVPWMSTTGGGWKRKPTHEELTTLTAAAGSLDGLTLDYAEATIVHSWDDSLLTIGRRDGDRLTFTGEGGHPAGAFGVRDWCLWNVPEAFAERGTFMHDVGAGKLYYLPLEGETLPEAYIPTCDSVFYSDAPLSDVTLEGFSVSVTDTPRRAAGFGALAMPGAVQLGGLRGGKITGLKVYAVGGYGIKLDGVCENVSVAGCEVSDCGAGGIRIGSPCPVGYKSSVSDCYVHNVGAYYPSAIGIASTDTHIRHCEVCHTSYSAINCGGSDYTVEKNLLHDAMEVLNDGAAIYSFGSKRGVMRGNLAYGIRPKNGHSLRIAYYLDETAADWLVCGNVSVDCDFPNHNHMCGGHLYKDNIFVNGAGGLRFTMHNPSSPNRYVGNRLSADGNIVFEAPSSPSDGISEFSGNIYHSGDGNIRQKLISRYSEVGERFICEGESVPAVNFTKDDRIFEAYGLKLDLSDVGVRK